MVDTKRWNKTFVERLNKNLDELKWLYMELYHNDEQAFDYFVTMLYNTYKKRKPKLKEWDEAREIVPDWFRGPDMLGMVMYANCFNKNLKGVRKELDYIRENGVNYLHLMPLLQSPEGKSDGGYAVSNFREIDPKLGTMRDLANLTNDCHDRGMVVCMDFVMNHTSEDHEWAVRARNGEQEFMERYYFYDNWDIPNQFEKDIPDVFPTTAPGNYTWVESVGKPVMTMFYPYQWDLNYANPVVFNDMTENMLYLCNQGVDIIRLDAVPYIWKRMGTDCRNQPEVHSLVRMMHIAADIVCPGTLLLGEVVMEPSKVVPYFGSVDKPECHMLYNVTTMATTWSTVATKDVRLLKHQLGLTFALPHEYTFLNYLRCHDDIGWGLDYDFLKQFGIKEVAHKKYINDVLTGRIYGCDGRGELYNDDPTLGDARLCGTTASLCGIEAAEYERNDVKLERCIRFDVMLHAYLFSLSGIPVIYSGDEVGQLNDYTYHEDPLKWDDSRYIHRGNFRWDDAKKRHDPKTRPGKIFTQLRKLEDLRSQNKVFGNDADTWIVETYNDHVLGIGRYYDKQKMICLYNFNDYEETAWIDEEGDYTDAITGQKAEVKNVLLEGYGFRWFMMEF